MIIQLNQRLANEFRELPKTLFFEYQNLADLAEYFMDHYAHEIIQRIPDVAVMKRNSSVQPSVITPKRLSVTQNPSKSQDIAIIGMSGRYPEAQDLAEFWHNLYVGKDCIREIPKERWALEDYFDVDQENPGKTYSKWGGFLTDVDQFDPLFLIYHRAKPR